MPNVNTEDPTEPLTGVVFIIDDDEAVLRRLTRETLKHSSMGVLTASHLADVLPYLEKYSVDAVLADIKFRHEMQHHTLRIFDGLDALKGVNARWPTIPLYVISMDIADRSCLEKAKRLGVEVSAWFDKLGGRPKQLLPWQAIERDLCLRALKSDRLLQSKVTALGHEIGDLLVDENLANRLRSHKLLVNVAHRTYLQNLPDDCGYILREPLEVHCWQEGKIVKTSSRKIPVLIEGEGEDVVEALDSLADQLVQEKRTLDAEDTAHVSGYADYIKNQLGAYLAPVGTGSGQRHGQAPAHQQVA